MRHRGSEASKEMMRDGDAGDGIEVWKKRDTNMGGEKWKSGR